MSALSMQKNVLAALALVAAFADVAEAWPYGYYGPSIWVNWWIYLVIFGPIFLIVLVVWLSVAACSAAVEPSYGHNHVVLAHSQQPVCYTTAPAYQTVTTVQPAPVTQVVQPAPVTHVVAAV